MENGKQYEKGRLALLRGGVNNLITKAKDVKFQIFYNNEVVHTYNFEEWVQVIYGGRSPFSDEFHDVLEEISHMPTILASIIFKRILRDAENAENGALFDLTNLKWILKEDKDV